MAGVQLGVSPQIRCTNLAIKHLHDWVILVVLGVIIGLLNLIEPFHRYLSKEMLTPDVKYPFKEDSIPMFAVPVYAGMVPILIFLMYYSYRKDAYDLHYAIMGILYSVLITGVITESIKDTVGRPRPNFFFRCFPDGKPVFQTDGDVKCTNLAKHVIKEGYKSFPCGHTSWSFAGLGFLAWYLSGKIKAFDGKGHAAKLCIVLLPYLVAALVGVSRVDNYWHHWTDVFTGAIIGTTVSAVCYLQFFPFPHLVNGWAPRAFFRVLEQDQCGGEAMECQQLAAVDLESAGRTF